MKAGFFLRIDSRESIAVRIAGPSIRDSETTIKIKFAPLRGVGPGGREENRPKTLFLVGNATTIKFAESADFRVAPVRFGSVTVWGWNGSSGSGFRFRRFL